MSSQKVAFLGNMNNINFCIVRYLRDMGIDAHLFLGDEFEHFLPEGDGYSAKPQSFSFVHNIDWHKTGHWKISKAKIRQDLTGFSFIAATDRNVAYLHKAGIKVDLFIPHGGDIFDLPFYKFKNLIPERHEIGAWFQALHQLKGIRNSRNILMDYMNPDFERIFTKLNYRGNRIMSGFPIMYMPAYETSLVEDYAKHSPHVSRLREFKKNFKLVLISNSRLVWTDPKTQLFHYKANDRMLRAVAELIRAGHKIGVVLFEAGVDYPATGQLIEELKIQSNVIWYPRLNRKDIIPLMVEADIVSNEFENSWNVGGVISESLITGKPLLTYRRDNDYSHYERLYPVLNARTQEEIKEQLLRVINQPEILANYGKTSREWFEKFFVEIPMNKIKNLITGKAPLSSNAS